MGKRRVARLKKSFFLQDTVTVARELLGKILTLIKDGKEYRAMIVETEAYLGNGADKAAHFSKGLTNRTRIINESGGHIYIYSIYGVYQCFNIVTLKEGEHGAVLIRAVEPLNRIEELYFNRYKKPFESPEKREIINLTNGPAKFTMAYGLTKGEYYGLDITDSERIFIEDHGIEPDISCSRRVNVDYAEEAIDFPYRFYIEGNEYVSRVSQLDKKNYF